MTLSDPARATLPVFAARLGSWRVAVERAPLTPEGLAARYDAAAPGWPAALDRHDMPSAYAALLGDALAGAGDAPISALDCGMGTGALSIALCRVARGPVRIHGVDISSAMLAAAEAELRGRGVDISTRRGDLSALPYGAASFDVTMAAHVVEHLPDPRVALREMVRVTRPGGRVVVCATRATLRGLLIQLGWRTHRLSPATLARWMGETGMTGIRRLEARSRRFDALSSAWVGTVPGRSG